MGAERFRNASALKLIKVIRTETLELVRVFRALKW
jgi:hypothetical protein